MTELCRCPICGGSPSIIQYIKSVEDRGWSVGCLRCNVFVTDEDKDNAIRFWNEVNNREGEPAPILKPCPFCGRAVKIIHVEPSGYDVAHFNDEYATDIVHVDEDEKCIIDKLMSCNQREESMMIALWNRRVKE